MEFAAGGEESHKDEGDDVADEFNEVGLLCARQGFPEDEQDSLANGSGPNGAVEVTALAAFAFGRDTDAGQFAEDAEEKDDGADGGVGVVVDLLEVPGAGEGSKGGADQIEEREVDGGVPGEGVADAAVEGIGAVFVEAKDVGLGLRTWQLTEEPGNAGADHDDSEPECVPGVKSLGKEGEGEGARGEKEDPNPQRPVAEAVDRGIVIAELSLVRIFNFSAVFHWD